MKSIILAIILSFNFFSFGNDSPKKILLERNVIFENHSQKIVIDSYESENGMIIHIVLGWIAGELISIAAESVCNSLGGHSETCEFVGEAASMLVGMKGKGVTKAKTKNFKSKQWSKKNPNKVSSKVKYDKSKDEGEVKFETGSKIVAEHIAQSLLSHYFESSKGKKYKRNNEYADKAKNDTYSCHMKEQKLRLKYLDLLDKGKKGQAKKLLGEMEKVHKECIEVYKRSR